MLIICTLLVIRIAIQSILFMVTALEIYENTPIKRYNLKKVRIAARLRKVLLPTILVMLIVTILSTIHIAYATPTNGDVNPAQLQLEIFGNFVFTVIAIVVYKLDTLVNWYMSKK